MSRRSARKLRAYRARRTLGANQLGPERLEPRLVLATVGGVIAADTVWSLDQSPYEVTSDISVLPAATLKIEPGVQVLVNDNTRISIAGRLVAEGTAFERITFDVASGGSQWEGIAFTDTLADSRITFADMRNGDGQGEAIIVDHSRLLLDNVVWEGTTGTILEMEHPSLIVRNSHFPVSEGGEIIHGEHIEGDEYLIIEGNVFENSDNGGDVIDVLGADRPGPVMQILNNVFKGGGDDGLDLDGTDAHVEGNLFMNFNLNTGRNTTANAIATGLPQSGEDNRTQVTIVRNIFLNSDHAVLLKEDAFATIENNLFVGMTEAVIQFNEVGGTAVNGPGLGARLDGNIFSNNAALFRNLVDDGDFKTILEINRSLLPNDSIDFDGNSINPHSLGEGNIAGDPQFVDAASGDYRLRATSPAIGTGPGGLDMGAYVLGGPTITNESLSASTGQATFTVAGPGITHYRYRLNDEPYGPLTAVDQTIELNDLPSGDFTLDVIGMNDAGEWYSGEVAAFHQNTAQIIAPASTRAGETLPMVVRILDWRGETNSLFTQPLESSSAGDLDVDAIKVKKGVGSASPLVTAAGDFEVSFSGAVSDSEMHSINLLDAAFPRQTYGGTLSGDTVWDATADRQITANLTIPAGSSLTIEPGTRVLLDAAVNVLVEGELSTNGTISDPIVFNAADASQPWGGLELIDTTGTIQYTFLTNGGGDESRLFGHSDSQPLIFVDGSTLNCDNCYVINNTGKAFGSRNDAIVNIHESVISDVDTGAQFNNSIVTVTNTWLKSIPNDDGIFNDDDNDGFYFNGVHSSGSPSRFHDSFIIETKDDGLDHNGARLEVLRAWIEGADHEGIASSNDNDVHVDDSVFIGNNQGVEAGYRDPDLFVNNSVLYNNRNDADANSPITAGVRFGDGYDGSNGSYTGHITATNLVIHDNGDNVRNWDGEIGSPQPGAIDITNSLTNDSDYNNDLGNQSGVPVFGPHMHLLRGSAGRDAGNDGLDMGRRLPATSSDFQIVRPDPLLRINEIYASAPVAVAGEFYFIELFNGGGTAVDLSGYRLSDDLANPDRFVIPAGTTIGPSEFRTFVAANQDANGFTSTGYFLNPNGGEISLFAPAGGGLVDSVEFNQQLSGRSLVRLSSGEWSIGIPTPDVANLAVATATPNEVKINEWLAEVAVDANDFVELYNSAGLPTDLGSLLLTNDPADASISPIGPLTFVAAEGLLTLFSLGSPLPGTGELGFDLAANGGEISLSDNGTTIDSITYDAQTSGVSQGRRPNGGEFIDFFDPPNPQQDNPVDATPPTTPANLSAVAVGGLQAILSWTAAQDSESGIAYYRVYRDGTEIGTSTATSFMDVNVVSGEAYSYTVSAVNGVDLEGPTSVPAMLVIPDVLAFQDGAFPNSSYTGAQDTWLRGTQPNTNTGNNARMDSDGESGTSAEWTLLRWDLSSLDPNTVVTAASITLTVNNASADDYPLYAMATNWVESEATWNGPGGVGSWETPGTGPSDRGSQIGVLSTGDVTGTFDVVLNTAGVDFVNSWIRDPASNLGLIIYNAAATDGMEMRSSEFANVSLRPKLSLVIADNPLVSPEVSAASVDLGSVPQSVSMTFSEPVSIDVGDLRLQNTTTGAFFFGLDFAYNESTDTATWHLNSADGVFPPGDYHASVSTEEVVDLDGNNLLANEFTFVRVVGDTDGDQTLGAGDIGRLCGALNQPANNLLDLDADGSLTTGDVDFLVRNILSSEYGDANLDGVVDTDDYTTWAENRFTAETDWDTGDFNCDGNTDGSDFNIWNDHRFLAAAAAAPRAARSPRSALPVSVVASRIDAAIAVKLPDRTDDRTFAASLPSLRLVEQEPVTRNAVFRELARSTRPDASTQHRRILDGDQPTKDAVNVRDFREWLVR